MGFASRRNISICYHYLPYPLCKLLFDRAKDETTVGGIFLRKTRVTTPFIEYLKRVMHKSAKCQKYFFLVFQQSSVYILSTFGSEGRFTKSAGYKTILPFGSKVEFSYGAFSICIQYTLDRFLKLFVVLKHFRKSIAYNSLKISFRKLFCRKCLASAMSRF